jgi:hypothetical protein
MESAVEFLNKRYRAQNGVLYPADFDEARKMFEKQIRDTFVDGHVDEIGKMNTSSLKYYEKTFKTE